MHARSTVAQSSPSLHSLFDLLEFCPFHGCHGPASERTVTADQVSCFSNLYCSLFCSSCKANCLSNNAICCLLCFRCSSSYSLTRSLYCSSCKANCLFNNAISVICSLLCFRCSSSCSRKRANSPFCFLQAGIKGFFFLEFCSLLRRRSVHILFQRFVFLDTHAGNH